MKTIGLIGGMSWESTVPYYAIINRHVAGVLGGLHSAKVILYSVEFDEIEKCQSSGDWARSAGILADAARRLQTAGADMILICTNTMHKVYAEVAEAVAVPVIHIADATGDALEADGIRKTALLGTRYTMTEDFYKSKLIERGFEVIIPQEADIGLVNSVIFEELCKGRQLEASRRAFSRIIDEMKSRGAEAVILGCTEIGMLVTQKDSSLPIYDTTVIHAARAAALALEP